MLNKQQSWTNVRERVTPEEWEQRVALAAVYRLVAHFRWDDLIFTHLSARVPGPEHHFLINPYGMTFDEVTASSLVKVALDANRVVASRCRRRKTACCRSRSNRSSCSRRWPITITKAWHCVKTKSRGSCATSAIRTTSCCAITA